MSFQRLVAAQVCLVLYAAAVPVVLVPSSSVSKRSFDRLEDGGFGLDKRSFDRLDDNAFGLVRKRSFDRVGMADFGMDSMRRKRSFDRLDLADFDFDVRRKRSFDRVGMADFGLDSYRRKRSFDRLDMADFDFDVRRKRSFDRLSGSDFGLVKRSAAGSGDAALLESLAASIDNVRAERAAEAQAQSHLAQSAHSQAQAVPLTNTPLVVIPIE